MYTFSMDSQGFPKKQFLILIGVCAAVTILALVIGLINKDRSSAVPYEVEQEVAPTNK